MQVIHYVFCIHKAFFSGSLSSTAQCDEEASSPSSGYEVQKKFIFKYSARHVSNARLTSRHKCCGYITEEQKELLLLSYVAHSTFV